MNYKKILLKMIKEEEAKRYYLRVCLSRPNTLATKEYYKKELDICNAKIEALTFVIN